MPENKDFALRIEVIDECLRNRYRKWTLQDLVSTVSEKLTQRYGKSASKRTIQGDMQHMKEVKDAPIEKRKEGAITYFYYSDVNYSIKNLLINEEEISFLKDAVNILRQVSDFEIIQDVDEIVNKLQNTIKTNIIGKPSIIQFEKHSKVAGTEYIDNIFNAIKEKSTLRIIYQSFNNTESNQYIFHPYLLKEYRNRWFVIGRINHANAITNFALDRIKEIKNSNIEFLENNLFDAEKYFNNIIGVTFPQGQKVESIKIRVASKQSPYLRTKPIHHTQEIIKEYKNGDIIINLWLICNYELKSTLLSYGSDIEVIRPISLRKEMKEIFKTASSLYSK